MRHSFTIILILACLFLLNQAILSQINPIPNHSFEDWVGDEPVDWTTSNSYKPGGVIRSDDAVDGMFSVKLIKVDTTGPSLGGRLETTFPTNIRYSAIKFDIKYVEKFNSDAWVMEYGILVYKSGNIMGGGGDEVFVGAMDWTEVVRKINYNQGGIPDSALIVMALVDSAESMNYALFDDIELIYFSITKPAEGDDWNAGTEDTIKWDGGLEGSLAQLEFSADSGNTFELIDNFIPADTGLYVWAIPDTIQSNKCYIRIFDMAYDFIVDTSDLFKISGLSITNPAGGDKWIAGTEDTIKWDGGKEGDLVQLEFSADSGNTFGLIILLQPIQDCISGQFQILFFLPNVISAYLIWLTPQ